ncbi:MAG TPA: hypothetical protein VIG99_06875 [Myxococcaceae bacterium]
MRSRSLARWVALTAACLSLVGSAAPAWELPRAGGPVAAMVVGASAARPARAARSPRTEAPRPPRRALSRTGAPAPHPTPRAGTRALFILHRALLR